MTEPVPVGTVSVTRLLATLTLDAPRLLALLAHRERTGAPRTKLGSLKLDGRWVSIEHRLAGDALVLTLHPSEVGEPAGEMSPEEHAAWSAAITASEPPAMPGPDDILEPVTDDDVERMLALAPREPDVDLGRADKTNHPSVTVPIHLPTLLALLADASITDVGSLGTRLGRIVGEATLGAHTFKVLLADDQESAAMMRAGGRGETVWLQLWRWMEPRTVLDAIARVEAERRKPTHRNIAAMLGVPMVLLLVLDELAAHGFVTRAGVKQGTRYRLTDAGKRQLGAF